jgi:hypothetical protein
MDGLYAVLFSNHYKIHKISREHIQKHRERLHPESCLSALHQIVLRRPDVRYYKFIRPLFWPSRHPLAVRGPHRSDPRTAPAAAAPPHWRMSRHPADLQTVISEINHGIRTDINRRLQKALLSARHLFQHIRLDGQLPA